MEGEFCSLRFLVLEELNLVRWIADEMNFRMLHRLVIVGCSALEKIPSGIGYIPALESIDLDEDSRRAVESARLIQKEQLEEYDVDIKIHVFSSHH